jgi:hypothetical protein
MILSAAFGFIVGEALGRRKCLEQANDDLRDQLNRTHAAGLPLLRELKQQRREINDIHKQIVAVRKGLEKRPS